jgi:segregation and condensation protein B
VNKLEQYIEALLFASPDTLSEKRIQDILQETFEQDIPPENVGDALSNVISKYASEEYVFEVIYIDGGYTFRTKGAYFNALGVMLKQDNPKKLSRAALETLSIIAYKQPVTKPEIEHIRGVNCDYTIQKLLEKELIAIMGRKDAPGKPLIYGTSDKFMQHFGLGSIDDLPQLKEIKKPENEIGEPAPIEELTLPKENTNERQND